MPHPFIPDYSQATSRERAATPLASQSAACMLSAACKNLTKRLAVIVISALIASSVAVGASMADPQPAQAAGGGYVKKCGGGKINLNDKEKKTFALHNDVRKDHGLSGLCVHPKLQKAARAHSKDMIRRDYFSHNTKGRGSFEKRLKRFGYTPEGYKLYMVGENIAYGSGSYGEPESIMRGWMNSDVHRHNILKDEFREIGIGTYTGTYKNFKGVTMYTADFGVRQR
jgi:uncharacterized protein YkwD